MKEKKVKKYNKSEFVADKNGAIQRIAELEEKVNEGRKLSLFGKFCIDKDKEIIQRCDKMLQHMEAEDRYCIYILVNEGKETILPYEIGDALWTL